LPAKKVFRSEIWLILAMAFHFLTPLPPNSVYHIHCFAQEKEKIALDESSVSRLMPSVFC